MQVLQVQMEVRPDPAEVGRARRWARSRLVRSGVAVDEPLAETLVLLISELVTNAVVHTGCPAVLRMLFPAQCADPTDPADLADGGQGRAPAAAYGAAGLDAADPAVAGTPALPPGAGAGLAALADGAYGADPTPAPATGVGPPAVAMVRVEVADASACPPRPRCADDDDTNGRGLELVDGLADRWGWQPEGNGKSIWCEVDRQGATAPPTAYSGAHLAAQLPEHVEPTEVVPHGLVGGATRSEAGGSEVLGPAAAAATVTTAGTVAATGTAVAIERAVSLAGACATRRRAARQM
uniref:ATP-binding protein n=1 Tax=Streptomyces buecherae TaxID=2763006 RepID=UPI001E34AB91|nr:ATP-binding protein [Streptomyces buecherae]